MPHVPVLGKLVGGALIHWPRPHLPLSVRDRGN